MAETQTAQGRATLTSDAVQCDYADAVAVAFEEAIERFAEINKRDIDYDTLIFWGGLTTYEVIIEVRDGM